MAVNTGSTRRLVKGGDSMGRWNATRRRFLAGTVSVALGIRLC